MPGQRPVSVSEKTWGTQVAIGASAVELTIGVHLKHASN